MKKHTRILALLLVVMTLVSVVALPASAASTINCQYTGRDTGGGSKYFTFTATKSGTASIQFSMGQGHLLCNTSVVGIYGSYEIKVRDAKNNIIYDEDAYCTSSKTIKFKVTKGQTYNVQVYFWQAKTTATSYYNKGKLKRDPGPAPLWYVFPSITAKNPQNGTIEES